jgi:two-component system sensor histidine kinase CpxA
MHSLFGKIFGWYLLSALVIMGAVAVTMLIVRNDLDASRFRTLSPKALSDYPSNLIQALTENRAADVEHIEAKGQPHPTPLYVFDQDGKELLGKPAPAPITQLFERTSSSRQVEILSLPFSAYIARYFVGGEGKGYVLVYALTRVKPFRSLSRIGASWAFVTLLLALIVLLCWWLTRQLVVPILAVGSALSRLAEGDLHARIESNRFLSGGAELITLASNFNFMAERMEGLVAAQRRWIADAAHEVGSPLTRLSVALGIAQQKAPANVLPYLDRMEEETDRLRRIMQQLLTLAQMDALPQPAATERIDLADLLASIVNDCDFEAQACGRSVRLDCSADCSVLGTRELLRSAIENVVRNAVRYTHRNTEVSVMLGLNSDKTKALIAVRDHGPGVPEDALKLMFEPFYRVRDRPETDPEGRGLGLAITSRAVAAHRGSLCAANAAGGGLDVKIDLPVAGH